MYNALIKIEIGLELNQSEERKLILSVAVITTAHKIIGRLPIDSS